MSALKRRPQTLTGILAAVLIWSFPVPGFGQSEPCHYKNGRWLDGAIFAKKSFYTADGQLLSRKPEAGLSCEIDLDGRYVIPPFAEAHIHSLFDPEDLAGQVRAFLDQGVFYVLVQDAILPVSPATRALMNRLDTPDVIYAQGVMLPSWYGSVIDTFYQPMAAEGFFGKPATLREIDGRVFFLIDTAADVEEKWDRVAAMDHDVVKVLLAFSEQFEVRRSQPDFDPQPGIDPALLPAIVQKAHASGRRVSVHVETAADFHVAVAAGADLIAHLPGWRIGRAAGYPDGDLEPWMILAEDARLAAERGVVVITTAHPKSFLPDVEENRPRFAELHRANLRLLRRYGVEIAVGSDNRRGLLPSEIFHLAELGVFDRPTLLRLAVETTPRVIFPNRRIGKLRDGWEASFLVLDGDPLADLANIRKIFLRVKQGVALEAPGNAASARQR